MIISVSIENSHLYGDVIPSIFRLRYQGFKERQSYDVPSYKNMEYDAYDTPATTYLAWRDADKVVKGCIRLFPTTRPYMIEELWPQTVYNHIPLPKEDDIWESSRICIDRYLPVEIRKQIHGEILCALQEFGLKNNITSLIGVMTPGIWRSVFASAGIPIEFLGPKYYLDSKEAILTGKIDISYDNLEQVRKKFNINKDILASENEQKIRRIA